MSAARANRVRSVASVIYSLAVKWRYVSFNPITAVPIEEEDLSEFKYWSLEEVEQFLTCVHSNNLERFYLYHLLYETGIRISEAIALQWDCANFDSGTIEVRRAYCRIQKRVENSTKGKRKRILGISESLRATLLRLRNSKRSDFVFSKPDGSSICYEVLFKQFMGDQMKAKVPRIGLHGVRHTFASHFVMKGGTIYDLKELLGHTDIKTTERYAHLAPNHLQIRSSVVNFQIPKLAEVIELKAANQDPTMEAEKEKLSLQEGFSKAK